MKEQKVYKYQVVNGRPAMTEDDIQHMKELNKAHEGEFLEMLIRTPKEIRSLLANRYLRGYVYPAYVPDHFDYPHEAHAYFTDMFLMQHDVIDLLDEDLEREMERITRNASRSRKTIKIHLTDTKIEITWVKSTAVLSKRDFAKYTNNVKDFGIKEFGLQFLDIDKVDLTNRAD